MRMTEMIRNVLLSISFKPAAAWVANWFQNVNDVTSFTAFLNLCVLIFHHFLNFSSIKNSTHRSARLPPRGASATSNTVSLCVRGYSCISCLLWRVFGLSDFSHRAARLEMEGFIGKRLSLITKADIRYEGVLQAIALAEQTITLANVRSYGTEGRSTTLVVPPGKPEGWSLLQFKSDQIKDLTMLNEPVRVLWRRRRPLSSSHHVSLSIPILLPL